LAVAESAKVLDINFQLAGRGCDDSKAVKEPIDDENRESRDE
jgi:hypothetical protein